MALTFDYQSSQISSTSNNNVSITGDGKRADNEKLILGDDNNLEIYHDQFTGMNWMVANSPLIMYSLGNMWLGGSHIGIGNPGANEYYVELSLIHI